MQIFTWLAGFFNVGWFKNIFDNILIFFSNNSSLLKTIGIGMTGLFLFYKFNSYNQEIIELKAEKTVLEENFSKQSKDLKDLVKIAEFNKSELEREQANNNLILENLKTKHELELKDKQIITIIREKTYNEKDSDIISPVLRNTLIGLFGKTK